MTPEIDLGEQRSGRFVRQVPIGNSGNATLAISGVTSTCTCATVRAPRRIAPGATAAIDVTLNIRRGPERAILTVQSNDPAGEKKVVLRWHGESQPVLHPVRVVATSASPDRPFERTLKVIYPGGQRALSPYLEAFECESANVRISEGQNHPIATKIGGASELTFGELDLQLAVEPPVLPVTRLETVCYVTVGQGQKSFKLGFSICLDFLGGKVAPDVGGVVFAGTSANDLIGQERLLTVAGSSEFDIDGLPDWLTHKREAAANGVTRLRFEVTRPPQNSHHTVHLAYRGNSTSRIPVVIHCITLSDEVKQ